MSWGDRMTADDLERALRALARRRPFRPFLIELHSGDRIQVSHPEAVQRYGELFLSRATDRGQRGFAGPSVCQFIDPPIAAPPG
jgi:hypothetical protein